MDWKKSFNIGYVFLAVAVLFLLQDMRDPKHTETIAYSEFKQLLKAGAISDVSLGDEVITGSVTLQGLEKILPAKRLEQMKKGTADHRYALL